MLELKNICKTFNPGTINAKSALNDLSLTLADGDFVTVIGGNGAGKSTMLNAIAGVFPVDSGSILIDGQDVTKLPEHKRAALLGRVFTGRGAPRDGKPEHLIEYGKQSAQALGVDSIDLLYLHRHDPEVPYNESCEGIKALLDQGVAQWAGVSNVSIEQLKIAQEILGDKLVAVQNQYSPIHLETQDTLEYCAKEGLAFVCWSPLGGYRHPYDEHLFDPFREVAAKHGVSYQRVVLAWELAKGDHMFVIPGAHRPETILDSLKADELELTDEELAFLG